MSLTLNVIHQDQLLPVDLSLVTGLDALVYRQTTGEELDSRLWLMIQWEGSADDRPLADRAVLAWLFYRQIVDPNADLAVVASTLTMIPPAADPAAGLDAPGVQ